MIYINLLGVLIISILLVFKLNYLIRKIQGKDGSFANVLKTIYGWPIAAIFGAISILLLYVYEVPGYYIQLADLILTLIIIAVYDAKWRIIPNCITVSFLISQLAAVFCLTQSYIDIWNTLISVAILLVLAFVSKISKEELGMGDVKLIAAINLIYGLSFTMYSLLLTLIIMLVFSVPLLIMKKLKMKSQLPFAPFHLIGVSMYIILNLI